MTTSNDPRANGKVLAVGNHIDKAGFHYVNGNVVRNFIAEERPVGLIAAAYVEDREILLPELLNPLEKIRRRERRTR